MKSKGAVYLVGAGPGDPGLLTLRGAELLRRADVVVYDALVSPEVMRLVPERAERIYGGKRSRRAALGQGDLNTLLVEKAREGKVVVRLKGGDPYTFGRGGEEAAQLAEAGVAFEVVPGISSAVAAPNYAGIPLTHREHCSSVTVLTGHEDPDAEDCSIDWAQVARTPGTKVVMMGLNHIRQMTRRLIHEGMPPTTPAAMIRWGTTPRQVSIQATLADIGDVVEQTGFGAPAITVIGEVVQLRSTLNWFEQRPLFGRRIVVTRPVQQADEFVVRLTDYGADVLSIPVIRFSPPEAHQPVVDALAGLNGYDWIMFTSANGVRSFFESFFKGFADLRDIGGVRIAAVGPATAAAIKALHLNVDLVPAKYEAEEIGKAMVKFESIENLRILLPRAEVATPELPRLLEEMGAIVDDVPFYRTEADTEAGCEAAEALTESGADWVTFTSGSTVRHFHKRFDLLKLLSQFPAMKTATIGPETSRVLREVGLEPTLEAEVHTTDGLVQAILRRESQT